MTNYLFRITTERDSVWSDKNPKPVYLVARDKEEVLKFANERLQTGLRVKKIQCLAVQLAPHIYSGDF